MSNRRWLALLAAPAAIVALMTPLTASAAPAAPARGIEIIVADTAFGPALAVGSGPWKNYTLYYITSDHGRSYGCTTVLTHTAFGTMSCAGPTTDKKAEWPAITTAATPVAGPGVNAAWLGRVYRKGIGYQITYAGHPLYLFDYSPGAVTGEAWFEPGTPPWHGMWWLLSPSGEPVPWAGTLTTTRIVGGQTVLAELFQTLGGFVNFPVYEFSGDTPYYFATCSVSANCARAWLPVLTQAGGPGWTGVSERGVGTLAIPGHLRQVTWYGHPLYLFGNEQLKSLSNGKVVPEGNGNAIHAFGGTFSLVVNP
jgi:predicted lipoprotein with Yx(FWY)xxD motif